MAPVKRRAGAQSSRPTNNGPPPKEARNEKAVSGPKAKEAKPSPRGTEREVLQKNTQPSVLSGEEHAFPRGGAGLLTPLEHKQIKIEAERDVLFEISGSKEHPEDRSASDGEIGESTEYKHSQDRSSKKRKRSHLSAQATATVQEDNVKIESLSFRKLVPGSLVLGQVARIFSRDVALTLPNNLTGYVPLTSVSNEFNGRIETSLALSNEEEEDRSDNGDGISLQHVFQVGQYLRACVTSNTDEDTAKTPTKSKRRIELTVNPRQTNVEVDASDVTVGSTMQAAVLSIEDRGFVMDLGLNNDSLKGFVSIQELDLNVNASAVQVGTVWLCLVTGVSANKKTIQLSANPRRIGDIQKSNLVSDVPKFDNLLPGTAIQMLVTSTSSMGICGKIAGFVDATADWIHSGAGTDPDRHAKLAKVGSKTKARIICTFPEGEHKVVVSLLEHVLSLSRPITASDATVQPTPDLLPISAILDATTVVKVVPKLGLVLDLGNGLFGFAHMSRLSDGRVDSLSETTGPFRIGSIHRARILSYNSIDGVYILSLEQKIIEQPFLRLEDIKVGQLVNGTVEKLMINANGIGGLRVNLTEGIVALVPEMHLADAKLQYPERKFKGGMQVSARVLSIDSDKRSVKLTLKKTLVKSTKIWTDFEQISLGSQSAGTLVSLSQNGAVVQFFGNVRGFLPVSEMSEAYIKDPRDHFHVGQIVHVNVLSVEPETERMTVSCRDSTQVSAQEDTDQDGVDTGTFVDATVVEKTDLHFTLELIGSGRPAVLRLGQLTDGTEEKDKSAWGRIQTGQKLQGLLVLDKSSKRKLIILSKKPSLLKAARASHLLSSFQDVQPNQIVDGFVRNITTEAVFVEYAGGLVGMLPRKLLPDEMLKIPDFGLRIDQTIKARVQSLDHQQQRFILSMKMEQRSEHMSEKDDSSKNSTNDGAVMNPVDGRSMSMADFTLGTRTQARITSIKDTQLNVELADNIHGRVCVSQVFDSWENIQDKRQPLASFKRQQLLMVKIIGIHNSRTHAFLPITHRHRGNPVFELTAKSADQLNDETNVLTLDKLGIGSPVVGFVNNITDTHIWVTVSPNIRGRIELLDLSDDVSVLKDIDSNFPVGAALRTRVKTLDLSSSRLDLTAVLSRGREGLTINDISEGTILPGQVVKITGSALTVRLGNSTVGTVGLTQLADDYSEINPGAYKKNEFLRVCVLDVDSINQKIALSTRPSQVLSSSLPVTDPYISAISQVKVNDVVRGFVKHISDKGLFIRLSPKVTAFVRLADLSDAFLKDWKSAFKIDQLVKGKVTAIDEGKNYIQMSLKASMLDENYVAPMTFEDLKPGQIVNGKIRKVEDFGAFIVVDNSRNVSGLCHRSEVAENRVEDVKTLYEEGDEVKAIVLKVDREKRRVNFGLKASYFQKINGADEASVLTDDEGSEDDGGVALQDVAEDGSPDPEFDDFMPDDDNSTDEEGLNKSNAMDVDDDDVEDEDTHKKSTTNGLSTGGFAWDGTVTDSPDFNWDDSHPAPGDGNTAQNRKRKATGPEIDRTGNLDSYGPQSAQDFERQLLGQPNSSSLWIQYMAQQLQLGEVDSARSIAERALKTINMREEEDKANVWTALLNLENTYGDDDTLESVFKRACQYAASQDMHEKLASILIDSGKHQKADEVFQAMMRNKDFSLNPALWLNYATFLMTSMNDAPRARALLARATQSVPPHLHRHLTTRFAALEFTSPHGEPERGRTVLEGLVSVFPKRWDLWDQFVDLETSKGEVDNVRNLFERMTAGGVKMKARRAKFVFKRWLEFEQQKGTPKQVDHVKQKAEQFVARLKEGQGED